MWNLKQNNHHTHRKRDQICDYQRQWVEGGEIGEKVVKSTNSCDKIIKC